MKIEQASPVKGENFSETQFVEGDLGKVIKTGTPRYERFMRNSTAIVDQPLVVKNADGSQVNVDVVDYYKNLSFHHDLAFVVDGQAQIFARQRPKEPRDGTLTGADAIDPNEFNVLVGDYDGDGDDDLIVSFITMSRWESEKVELTSFENDGTGQFTRVGIDINPTNWSIMSAKCYGGICDLVRRSKTDMMGIDLFDKGLDEQGRVLIGIKYGATNHHQTTGQFTLNPHSLSIDYNSYQTEIDHLEDQFVSY